MWRRACSATGAWSTAARPRSPPPPLTRERPAALHGRLAALQPTGGLRAQLAILGEIVAPRAARVVAEHLARLADRGARRVLAVELVQRDGVAVVVAHELRE